MVCTVVVNIATITISGIFYNPSYCGSENEYQTKLAMIWSIFQSLPLLISFGLCVPALECSDSITLLFIPRRDNTVDASNLEQMQRNQCLPELSTISIAPDGRLHQPGAASTISVHLKKSWRSPRSTHRVGWIHKPLGYKTIKHSILMEPQDDKDGDDADPALVWSIVQAKYVLSPGCGWRKLHREFYWSTRYSLFPDGHMYLWHLLDHRIRRTAGFSIAFLEVIHFAAMIWGSVLLGMRWGDGVLCAGNVHLHNVLLFVLIYNWFIVVSFLGAFLLYTRWRYAWSYESQVLLDLPSWEKKKVLPLLPFCMRGTLILLKCPHVYQHHMCNRILCAKLAYSAIIIVEMRVVLTCLFVAIPKITILHYNTTPIPWFYPHKPSTVYLWHFKHHPFACWAHLGG